MDSVPIIFNLLAWQILDILQKKPVVLIHRINPFFQEEKYQN